jgi:Guanine nucleotide exchange factor in Golgi transport N-terminal
VCLSSPLPTIRDLYANNSCSQITVVFSHSIPSSYSYYNTTSSPCSSKLSKRSAFPLALRGTRIVFLLLKQFSSQLETEADVILTLLIKLISGETDPGEPRPGWMRMLAMEIVRR